MAGMTNFGKQYLDAAELQAIPFGAIGKNVLIHHRCNLINVELLSIGSNVIIDADLTILATGNVTIGNHVHIGAQCYLAGVAGIALHDFAGLSQGVRLFSGSDDFSGEFLTNPTIPRRFRGGARGQITLERHVIIGSGSMVGPKVTVAEGCAIGALSLVKDDTASWGIYAGVPVRRTGERNRGLLALEAKLLLDEDGEAATR